jgi:hypothetical protein
MASDVCDGQGIPEVCFQLVRHLSGCSSLIIWRWILECEYFIVSEWYRKCQTQENFKRVSFAMKQRNGVLG